MKDEILNELLNEILIENKEIRNENKEIRNEQLFLKTAFENFASQEQEALEHLKNFKVNIDLSDLKELLDDKMNVFNTNTKSGIIALSNERKEIIYTISNWKTTLILFLKISIIGTFVYLIVLLFGKYYMPVVKENLKYKNAYEYIYYNNEGSQDFLQKIILDFDNSKSKKALIKVTNVLKKESSNPLVFSK